MNRITKITKRAILDLFKTGVDVGIFEREFKTYSYYGRLSEIEFLKKLYPLNKMPPGNDPQFKTLEDVIRQHTVHNHDYDPNWIFTDDRFHLKDGSDTDYLKFICEIFNPEALIDTEVSKKYFKEINSLLRKDRYELYLKAEISGRNVYSWRDISEKEVNTYTFLPFSQRIKEGTIVNSIPKTIRRKLLDVMNKYEQMEYLTTDTGLNYYLPTKKAVMQELSNSYDTKCFDEKKNYKTTNDLEQFVMNNYPQFVFDAIETYCQFESDKIVIFEFNSVLETIGYNLLGGKIEKIQLQIEESTKKLEGIFTSEYLTSEIDLMCKMQKENPTEAIGKAKELIESCCKTILENYGINLDKNWDINRLMKETTSKLRIMPKDIPDDIPASTSMKTLLAALKTIANCLANIRNAYGTGHGRSNSYKGLQERHAKLAVGSSVTLVNFLWDSFLRQNQK